MNKRQIIIAAILIISSLGVGYNLYRYSSMTPKLINREETKKEISKNLTDLQKLKTLKLDTSVLQDQKFKNLESGTTTAVSTPTVSAGKSEVGRKNPFVPFQEKPKTTLP